jgi:hypothetical protein
MQNFQTQLAARMASLNDGSAIVLMGEQELGEFLDAIDQEVDRELANGTQPNLPAIVSPPPAIQ